MLYLIMYQKTMAVYVGPFDRRNDAVTYAINYYDDYEWEIVELWPPQRSN